MITEAFTDALSDSLRSVPFLTAALLIMEMLEKRSDGLADKLFLRFKKSGPVIGALFGAFPQCGFSAAASNLYAGGVISLGTLLAVFLSTSDEAVLIMLGEKDALPLILPLVLTKILIGVIFGFLIDSFTDVRRKLKPDRVSAGKNTRENGTRGAVSQSANSKEEKTREGSGKRGLLYSVLTHTLTIFGWLLAVSFILNILLERLGAERIFDLLGSGSFFQPLLSALFGLIPNCGVSVTITKLYLSGSLSFASTVAGLSSGAGVGLIVLFREETDKRKVFGIIILLCACAAAAGTILNLLRVNIQM